MNIMDVFIAISKHCRCGFNSLSSRCIREKTKCKKNSNTNRRGLPNAVTPILNKKWLQNVLNKYFCSRRKIYKSNVNSKQSIFKSEFEEKLETINVNNVNPSLSIPGSYKSDDAWRSIFVDLTRKGSMTYLIFVDRKTLYPEVFELGVRSLWKQTKRAFRDVFREYRIPVEIHTSEKVFFVSGKFVRFMEDHGIVTAAKTDAENNLANVLASVKVLIHNSRFWHEELRKLRESISKSLLSTKDEYVQVGDVSGEDMKCSMSDSSGEDSPDSRNDVFSSVVGKYKNYPQAISAVKERPLIKPLLLTKRKQMIARKAAKVDLVKINEDGLDWMHCLKSLSKTSKCQRCLKKGVVNNLSNKINSTLVDNDKYNPIKMSLDRNMTRIYHCTIDHNLISQRRIWKRTKNRLKKKINDYYHNHEANLMFHGKYDVMLNYLSKSNVVESESNGKNSHTVHLSGRNKAVFKLGKKGSGDKCTLIGDAPMVTSGEKNGLTSMGNALIRFPIEILPFKYDNLFITEKDLKWKAVVIDVIELSSKCYYMFIDCATKFPELFLQLDNKGIANVKFLINALCLLWQMHGKPIEIHSPKGSIFSCTKLSRFVEKYNMFFYYDSPFLRNDMKIGHIWLEYKNIFGKGNIYSEVLRTQRKVRKIAKEREKRETQNKRQKSLFSLNKTTIADAKSHLMTNPVEGILQEETKDVAKNISWKKIMVDQIHSNDHFYIIFIDIDTFYPEIKEIEYGSKINSAKKLIRTFLNFFNEKSSPVEIHVAQKKPFNIKGVIRFMERIGVSYYRQSRYFNGGNCVHMCLEHMKSLICQSGDLNSAIYDCRKRPLPWLGMHPLQMAYGNRMTPLFDHIVPPWAQIIIEIFNHGEVYYLIVFDYDSLYPECFQMHRNIFTNTTLKIIKACEKAFSVLGCPINLWTFDRAFCRSDSFLKFLRTRDINHFFLTSQKERETSSIFASFRQKLTMTGTIKSALVSTREAYNVFIGACPARTLREKESAVSEALQATIQQKKDLRFNFPASSSNDLHLGDL